MKTVSLVPQPGSGISNHPHQSEADAYLQDRLRIFYGVSAVAITGFLVLMEGVDLAVGDWSVSTSLLDPSQLVHMLCVVVVAAMYLALRRGAFGRAALRGMDAAGFLSVVAANLVVYWEGYDDELSPLGLTVLSTFVIARAIVVPSTAAHTLVLSLAAPLGLLAIHLLRGPQPFVAADPHAPAFIVWHQAVLLFSVAVATVAARVTFNLRNRVAAAQRLGEYRIEALVGEGGMGKVYRATHALLLRPTAIKVLDPDMATPKALARFEREVQLTSRLSHPSNVQVYDYGTTADGLFYYAMEFLEGMDLSQILEVGGPLPPERVIHVLAHACAALAEAHDLGLVHRDIKPANLLLCRRGPEYDVVKVVDYGIARDLEGRQPQEEREFEIAGTPDYMAPEIIRGLGAGPRSDLYSLGATAYHVLTGWRVFGARHLGDQLAHHVRTEPIPPRKRLATVPADLEAVILRCLAKDPAARFSDAHVLGEALASCAAAGSWTPARAEAWWRADRDTRSRPPA